MRAFAAIYQLYGRACYNLALRVLGQPAAAEDMVQDVFVRLIERIASYRGDAPFGAWLKRMTSNAVIDALRHRAYREVGDEDAVSAAASSGDTTPANEIDAWTMLQRLSPRSRAIVDLIGIKIETRRQPDTVLQGQFGQLCSAPAPPSSSRPGP